MKKAFAVATSLAFVVALVPVSQAQTASCPPEVAQAKQLLAQKGGIARGQDQQAPRSLAGARGQDQQAPRGQDQQAPRGRDQQAARGQDQQAPRGQDQQAPRGQDQQAPRGQDQQAPRSLAGAKVGGGVSKAATLVREAEAACKAGKMAEAKAKAQAALTELR